MIRARGWLAMATVVAVLGVVSRADAGGGNCCRPCTPAPMAQNQPPVADPAMQAAAPQTTRSYSYNPATTQPTYSTRVYYTPRRVPGYLLPKSSPLKFSVN